MKEREQIDIRKYSFEEFISFVFDHETPVSKGKRHPWYYDVEVTFDAGRVCEFYTRLFRHPDFVREKYSTPQLEQGFWAIQGPAFDCSAFWIMWNADLQFASRRQCVKSMSDLFNRLFSAEPLETSVQMWWDSLCYEWHCGNRKRERGGEDMSMQDVIFDVLRELLHSESEICQGAALHGLGHLHHPATEALIQTYLSQHPALSEERKGYARAAARSEVL
jgi:hypothetical protein